MAGDKSVFLRYIKENEAIIYKIAGLYAVDSHDLKDMYQETLYQAWKSWPTFRGDAKFSTWLYRTCLNTILTLRRKKSPAPYNGDLEAIAPAVAAQSTENEQSKALYRAIRALGETDKALISLHLEGFSNQEVAEIMGISTNYVGVKLHRVKEQLYKLLKTKEYGY
jgi:RNA polymerase sigma-70 factor (ECF subfamily)